MSLPGVNEAYVRAMCDYPMKDANEVRKYYNSWAKKYDDDVTVMTYRAPDAAVGKAATLISEEEKKRFKILDLGSVASHKECDENEHKNMFHLTAPYYLAKFLDMAFCLGTGLGGVSLRKFGFQGEIIALDGAAEMLKVAREKQIYSNCNEHILTSTQPLPYPDDTFDLIISVGVFGNNMIQPDCIQEVLRVLKQGYHFVLTIRMHSKSTEYQDRLEGELKRLEAIDLMAVASRKKFMCYNWKDVTADKELNHNDQFGEVLALLKKTI